MKPKSLYLVLCVGGTLFPYSQFLHEHGLDLRLFFEQLFATGFAVTRQFRCEDPMMLGQVVQERIVE